VNEKPKAIRYLLVEDNDAHAALVQRNLQRYQAGASIDRVADGAEALSYLNREGPFQDRPVPDVILLDLKLPKIDGIEVLERVKREERLRTIPVVMLTTSDEERDRLGAYQQHVNSYVVKPMEFDEFKKMIQDLGRYWSVWNTRPR
jgi:CheY-like chemotaxis protein